MRSKIAECLVQDDQVCMKLPSNLAYWQPIDFGHHSGEFLLQLLSSPRNSGNLQCLGVRRESNRASSGNEIKGNIELTREKISGTRLRAQATGH
jgi:hypothetical protein